MKIYLVKLNYDTYTFDTIGAYTSEDKANEVTKRRYNGEWISVEEVEIDEKELDLPLDIPL